MFAPNSIIEKLLQLRKSQAAMTLDALFATDAIQLESIEISSVLHYFRLSGLTIGESIVRKGLFDLSRLGLLTTFKILSRTKGRPFWNYRPQNLTKMAKVLGVNLHRDENRDAIPFTGFKTTRAYRAAKHYAYLSRLGKSRPSRKHLGQRLGVGRRTTANYEAGTNIKVTQMLDYERLTKTDIRFAPSKRISGKFFLEVHRERDMTEAEMDIVYKDFSPDHRILCRKKTTDIVYLPYTAFFVKRELEAGHAVFKAWQTTNLYEIV